MGLSHSGSWRWDPVWLQPCMGHRSNGNKRHMQGRRIAHAGGGHGRFFPAFAACKSGVHKAVPNSTFPATAHTHGRATAWASRDQGGTPAAQRRPKQGWPQRALRWLNIVGPPHWLRRLTAAPVARSGGAPEQRRQAAASGCNHRRRRNSGETGLGSAASHQAGVAALAGVMRTTMPVGAGHGGHCARRKGRAHRYAPWLATGEGNTETKNGKVEWMKNAHSLVGEGLVHVVEQRAGMMVVGVNDVDEEPVQNL
jgi:hypothetical protein